MSHWISGNAQVEAAGNVGKSDIGGRAARPTIRARPSPAAPIAARACPVRQVAPPRDPGSGPASPRHPLANAVCRNAAISSKAGPALRTILPIVQKAVDLVRKMPRLHRDAGLSQPSGIS